MKKSRIILVFFSFLTIYSWSQNPELEYRSVDYYFEQLAELEFNELLDQKVLIDSVTISEAYLDSVTNGLNKEGSIRYLEARMKVYQIVFNNYLYQQHIEFGDNVYVLYFTIAGFDDIEWNIVKWKKDEWNNEDKLSRHRLKSDTTLTKIFWNYDEGPKNLENIRMFVENDYLVFERGNLYHSLYDLKINTLIYNEESPWHASNSVGKDEMNEWIRINLHDKIKDKLIKLR
ncbi:MAG: hypothetical protein ACPGVI_01730 [Crocinitomicaceae bacterium]